MLSSAIWQREILKMTGQGNETFKLQCIVQHGREKCIKPHEVVEILISVDQKTKDGHLL
jgi:hypothetical protein